MIEREEVLHVARLARVRLTDQEIQRMALELSSVLDHIQKIGELELEGVEPTSHVVPLQNALRDDEPRPSLSPELALADASAPIEGGFGVPSPGG